MAENRYPEKVKQWAAKAAIVDKATGRRKRYTHPCKRCGIEFKSANIRAFYCSPTCNSEAMRISSTKYPDSICAKCGKAFRPARKSAEQRLKGYVQKHCSHECARGISVPKGSNRESITKSLKAKARWGRINPLKVLEKDGWRCYICSDPTPPGLRGSHDNKAPECDHVVPLTRGGSHSYDNMRCACRQCNRRKGNKLLSEMAA